MKPICVKCQRFFRIKKSGFYFIEGMPVPSDAKPGTAEPDKWKPYKIWSGDRWECQGCGAVIVSGCGAKPVSERHHDDFSHYVRTLNAGQFQVNDC